MFSVHNILQTILKQELVGKIVTDFYLILDYYRMNNHRLRQSFVLNICRL